MTGGQNGAGTGDRAGVSPGIYISEMLPADVSEVAEIEREIFSVPWSENGFLSSLCMEDSLYLVVRLEKRPEIAGYCGLLQSFDEADIINVAVRREYRGRGIGYALLCELMRRGRKRGIDRFTLEVRKSNDAALRLYGRLGFASVGIRRNFYEKPTEDAVIMWTV